MKGSAYLDFIKIEDIKDEILKVGTDDVAAANEYVTGLAARFRVKPSELLNPPTYTVKRIAICYACYIRAVSEVGTDATVNYAGELSGANQDAYTQKAKLYKQELEGLVNSLTALAFTGKEVGGSITVNVFRA